MRASRAREALIALTVLLTVAIFVLIPEQGRVALGVELLVVSIIVWGVSLRLQLRTLHALPARRRRSWIGRLIGLDTAIAGITLAGAGLVTGRLGGFLWLLPTVLICPIWATDKARGGKIHPVGKGGGDLVGRPALLCRSSGPISLL